MSATYGLSRRFQRVVAGLIVGALAATMLAACSMGEDDDDDYDRHHKKNSKIKNSRRR